MQPQASSNSIDASTAHNASNSDPVWDSFYSSTPYPQENCPPDLPDFIFDSLSIGSDLTAGNGPILGDIVSAQTPPPQRCLNISMRQTMRFPSPYMNYLQLQKLNFYAARIQNAMHLGVPLPLAQMTAKLPSPWYLHKQLTRVASDERNASPSHTACSKEACVVEQPARQALCFELSTSVTPDLAPTQLQLSQPHELYLDTIPFPIFRDRVITLLCMDPPAFDQDELKRDIESEGLMVWGVAQGANDSSEAVVRDKRNWECSTWFLQKWRLLVSGSGLDEQSKWWRRMRGEAE